jgi:hypothetical protein
MDKIPETPEVPESAIKCPLCVELPHRMGLTYKEQLILFGVELGLMAVMTSTVWTCQRHAVLFQQSVEHAKQAVRHGAEHASAQFHKDPDASDKS